jgi:putative peptidoglycan lipid II flippase
MTTTVAAADEPTPADPPKRRSTAGAVFVSLGIFGTKLFGIVRQAFIARFMGAGMVADAFNAALRIPNMLQNLLGEGAISSSFIPVYAQLVARGDEEESRRVAGAVLGLLSVLVAALVLLGIVFTPELVQILAGGFKGEKRALTVTFVRVMFPASGAFVLAAWCMGVLNSHRKFFLSYSAGIAWNVAIIGALLWFGPREQLSRLALITAWASVAGAFAQFFVQLPHVLRLVPKLRMTLDAKRASVRQVLKNFGPIAISRGVAVISNFIDQAIASFMPDGMVSLLFYATTISYVPVSIFGTAISAAELPEMASVTGHAEERAQLLRDRLNAGLRHIAFFVVPSAVALLIGGDLMAAALFQGRRFSHQDSIYTWSILAGSAFGLLASTMGRLYSSTYYALNDTKTPLRFAIVRVVLTSVLGYLFALQAPRLLGIDPRWGGAGLTLSFGVAGWTEFTLLRYAMNRRIGVTGPPAKLMVRLWGAAIAAGALAFGLKLVLPLGHPIVRAVIDLGLFGVVYLGVVLALGVPEARMLMRRFRRR